MKNCKIYRKWFECTHNHKRFNGGLELLMEDATPEDFRKLVLVYEDVNLFPQDNGSYKDGQGNEVEFTEEYADFRDYYYFIEQ